MVSDATNSNNKVTLGIAIYSMTGSSINYTLVGRHSVLLKYGAGLQNKFETFLINSYRSGFLNGSLSLLDYPSTANLSIYTQGLPFVHRDLVTLYSMATCVVFMFIPAVLFSDIAFQFVRDQLSGFRLILEVAGVSSVAETTSIIIANIPTTIFVALVCVIYQFAVGSWKYISPFSAFFILFIGFLANISFSLFFSIRSSGSSYTIIPVLMSIFSVIEFKDYFLYGLNIEIINMIYTPGTLATIVVAFHLLLPGKLTPSTLFKKRQEDISFDEETSKALQSDTPTLQLRIGRNTFGGKNIDKGIKNVNMDIKGGQSVALLGHNGAGKTTLINLICGVLKINDGFFRYVIPKENKSLTVSKSSSNISEIRHYLGFCPQHNALRDELSAYDHLEFIAKIRGIRKISRKIKTEAGEIKVVNVTLREYLEDILARLELTHAMNRPIKTYSGGMLRKTCLAVSLVGEPSILILDEFTTGMDIISRSQLWVFLKSLIQTSDKNRIVIFSTHDMMEAQVLSDYVTVIAQGEKKVFSSPTELVSSVSMRFHLQIEKSNSELEFDQAALENKFYEYFENSEISILKETSKSITYVLPKFSSKLNNILPVSEFLYSLFESKSKFGINEIDLDTESLEKVFLDITSESYVENSTQKKDGIRLLYSVAKHLDEKAESNGWNKASQEKINRKVAAMKVVSILIFSLKSAFVGNMSVYFASIVFVIVLSMWGNLFAIGGDATLSTTSYYSFPSTNASRGPNLFIPNTYTTSITNMTVLSNLETSLVSKDYAQLRDYQSVLSCILQSERPLSGWDISSTGMVMPNCVPGFEISAWPLNSNGPLNVTLLVDNQEIIFANSDKYATMIQRMYSLLNLIFTALSASQFGSSGSTAKQLPFGKGVNQPTYDQGYLVHFLNIARQGGQQVTMPKLPTTIQSSAKLSNFLDITAGYERIWDDATPSSLNSFLAIPLYVLGQTVIFSTVLQLLYKENKSGSSHHMLIHGLSKSLYKMSVVLRSLITSVFFCFIGIVAIILQLKSEDNEVDGGAKFTTSNFAAPEITIPLVIGWILFHVVAASASNVFAITLMRIRIFQKLKLKTSSVVSTFEYLSVIIWAIFRWFTSGITPIIALVISILNPIWTFHELMIQSFNKAFNITTVENYTLWIPTAVFAFQIIVFTFCTVYEFPRDTTTTTTQAMKNIKIEQSVKSDTIELQEKQVGSEPILDVNNLRFSYGFDKKDSVVLDDVSFNVSRGECFALLGRNGAGKSTTFKCLLGQLVPSSGSAFVMSQSLVPFSHGKLQTKLGYCPQNDDYILPGTSIYDLFLLYCRFKGIPASEHANVFREAFADFHLPRDQLMVNISELSGGTRRKVSIALALIGDPDFLVLDEPSAGVDILARSHIWEALIKRKKNKAISYSQTHIMEESEFLSDQIGFLVDGKLKLHDDPIVLKSRLAKSYNISIRLDDIHQGDAGVQNALKFIQSEIDENAQLTSSIQSSFSVSISVGILQGKPNIENKWEWMIEVLKILENGRNNRELTGIKEFDFSQKSLMQILFEFVEMICFASRDTHLYVAESADSLLTFL
ncbi:hypothetical protein HK096_002410 [Nowakowskiella sp. JEL0078]|nr:hypothetical protein HK096_002410 [Nowakowskiella sp. JEL0078]